jgi:hypothetical protein
VVVGFGEAGALTRDELIGADSRIPPFGEDADRGGVTAALMSSGDDPDEIGAGDAGRDTADVAGRGGAGGAAALIVSGFSIGKAGSNTVARCRSARAVRVCGGSPMTELVAASERAGIVDGSMRADCGARWGQLPANFRMVNPMIATPTDQSSLVQILSVSD